MFKATGILGVYCLLGKVQAKCRVSCSVEKSPNLVTHWVSGKATARKCLSEFYSGDDQREKHCLRVSMTAPREVSAAVIASVISKLETAFHRKKGKERPWRCFVSLFSRLTSARVWPAVSAGRRLLLRHAFSSIWLVVDTAVSIDRSPAKFANISFHGLRTCKAVPF